MATSPVSPLGRYAPAPEAGTDRPVTVRLLGLPVRVLAAAREHHDSLVREFRLLALSGQDGAGEVPARLVELTQTLGVRFAWARPRPDAEVDAALDRGDDSVDLEYVVPPDVAAAAAALDALMAEADEYCRTEHLMTVARGPVLVRFAQWYLEQFVDQVAGRPPTPWDGPVDP